MKKMMLQITDPVGLYLTPANALVSIASKYYSEVSLKYEGKNANLKSLMAVISLGIPTKAKIEIRANGKDEQQFFKEVKNYIIKNDIGVVLCHSKHMKC